MLQQKYQQLEIIQLLQSKPLNTLKAMLKSDTNCPLASSCGRLFDAVAAAVGICAETASYEGQAAIELEASTDLQALESEDESRVYPFTINALDDRGIACIDSALMWQALLQDLSNETPRGVISARFHKGLAKVISDMIVKITQSNKGQGVNAIALSGGVFQNKILYEQVVTRLQARNFRVLTHQQLPANDGGLSFGQAVVAAARAILSTEKR